MPVLEELVVATNTSFVTFDGITFEYATWRRPHGDLGYVEQQSGALLAYVQTGCDNTLWYHQRPFSFLFPLCLFFLSALFF